MKKKFLFLTLLVVALICIFAISVSAAEPDTTKETVTLSDGTVCPLWDTDGDALIWYITATSDGVNTYDYVKATSSEVNYAYSWKGDSYGAYCYQIGTITITVGDNSYAASTIVVANFMDDVLITSGSNIGTAWNCLSSTFKNSTNIQYVYFNANTVAVQGDVFSGCSNLKYVNLADLSELAVINLGAFNGCTSLFSGQVLDLTGSKVKYIGTGSFTRVPFTEIKLPNTLTKIDQYAFQFTAITRLDIPESVTSFSDNASFRECRNLTTVTGFKRLLDNNIVKAFGSYMFAECRALTNVDGLITDGVMVIPSTISSIGGYAFQNADAIKAVKFTASSTTFSNQYVFSGLDNLEYMYFPKNSTLSVEFRDAFSNNPKLKAVALPDNCTSLPDSCFAKCPMLKAVYLPANLENLRTNGWDQGAFTSDPELYFVNDWFNVLDENGDFLFEDFEMPSRPDVYYFPSTLTTLFDRASGGTGFYQCYKLNPYLVFGTGVTQININDGLLIDCGTKGETKTAVFLGNMTLVCHSSQSSRLQNIQYVFANPADKSPSDVTITNNNTNKPGDTAKIYFCASGTSYNMIPKDGAYGDSLGTTHFYLVAKETAPTCTVDGVKGFVCFCGVASSESEVIKATGHKASDVINSKYFTQNADGSINYFANMIKLCDCTACDAKDVEFEMKDTALFAKDKGYSFSETDPSLISYTLHVNIEAIKAYMQEKPAFMYGIVVSANPSEAPIAYANGTISHDAKTLVFEMQATEYVFEYVMAKITLESDYQENTLNCQAYAIENNTVTYVGHDSVSAKAEVISHKILVGKYESKEDLEAAA